jgi:O-antigen/teichoic acid export membrane protein
MSKIRRSLVISFFTSSGVAALQFAVSILLARLLSPSEIGVYSMAVVFVNIAHMFRDFGVGSYLQREADLTPDKIRSAIGVMFTSTWVIAALLYGVSGWIGDWLHEQGIVPIIRLLALGFLLIPFGAVTHAMLNRELAADKQAIVQAASTISYCASCVGLAALGCGTMSIAWANLISNLVTAIVYIPYRPAGLPWMPSFRNWKGITNFGMGTLLTNCCAAVNNSIPDVLLGKLGSARHVGLLSRANSTVLIFAYVAGGAISYGAVSYMSQIYHRGESLAPMLRRATALLTGIGWPAYALTAILGRDIVITLYGDKWVDCVTAMLPLTIAAAVSMMFNYAQPAVTAIGRPYLSAMPIVVTMVSRVAFGFLLFDGSLVTFAWAICVATIAAAPVIMLQMRRYLAFGVRDMLESVRGSVIVTVICIIGCKLLLLVVPSSIHSLPRLLIMALPLVALWYGALRLTRHQLVDEVHHLAAGLKVRLLRFV